MSSTMKKTLLISLAIFLTIIGAVAIVYFVRKPTTTAILPTPEPTSEPLESPEASPEIAAIFLVDQVAACTKTFIVACASGAPSPTASPSIIPSTPASASLDCVTKRAYVDDSRNRSGFYYIEQEIIDTSTLTSGQTVVYNVVAKNNGGNNVPDTTITDKLSENLTYVDGDTGCSYEPISRVVTCTIGSLSANSEAQRSFRAKIAVTGTTSIANTAEVSSTNGQRDSCSIKFDATGKVAAVATPAPTALPVAGVFEVTVGTVGIGLLLLIAGALGLLLI